MLRTLTPNQTSKIFDSGFSILIDRYGHVVSCLCHVIGERQSEENGLSIFLHGKEEENAKERERERKIDKKGGTRMKTKTQFSEFTRLKLNPNVDIDDIRH